MIAVSDAAFDPVEALKTFQDGLAGAGAVVSFSGHVRPGGERGAVQRLVLQAYPGLTERAIAAAMADTRMRWQLIDAHVIHRTGEILPGEAIVFVATAAAHRRAAFEAADFLMDYLKTDAYFWKKECRADGHHWIEPREEDHRDRSRWHAGES